MRKLHPLLDRFRYCRHFCLVGHAFFSVNVSGCLNMPLILTLDQHSSWWKANENSGMDAVVKGERHTSLVLGLQSNVNNVTLEVEANEVTQRALLSFVA